jgi:predicted nucleotidyltransferase
MLSDFLWTSKQQRILAALFMNPDRQFQLAELFEAAGGGRSSTQAYVDTLVGAGIVNTAVDRRTRYQVNAEHPLYPELRRIAVKSFGVREPVERVLSQFRDQIARAFIFGSVAAGTDTPSSDVDVMVVGDIRSGKATRELEVAAKELGREVHVNVYTQDEWETIRTTDPVVKTIDQGPKIELNLSTPAH